MEWVERETCCGKYQNRDIVGDITGRSLVLIGGPLDRYFSNTRHGHFLPFSGKCADFPDSGVNRGDRWWRDEEHTCGASNDLEIYFYGAYVVFVVGEFTNYARVLCQRVCEILKKNLCS
jgi:hypothetical protein